jgi:GNAT superfamily N-acetyltransferase
MKKLLLSLVLCVLTIPILAEEGVKAYSKSRDLTFIQSMVSQEKELFATEGYIADYDSESLPMNLPEETKKQLRQELKKQLPSQMHAQIEDLIKQISKIDKQQIFTYCIDGKPVGYVRVFSIQGACMVPEIVVAKEHRRKGYATKLLKYAVNEARKLKAAGIVMHVSDVAAIKGLCAKAGFKKQMGKDGVALYAVQFGA